MLIRSILTPKEKLITLKLDNTIKEAIGSISDNGFLSLPVVDDKKFIGFLSKQYVYEKFLESEEKDFEAFSEKPVRDFVYMKIEPVKDNIFIEEAADMFANNQVRFLPVVDSYGYFLGILTQKSLFEIITKVYGLKDAKIVIHSDDFAGTLSKIADIIYKHGANITNIAQMDTKVMGIQEISIRLEGNNLDKLVTKLQDKGIKVKEYIPSKK